MFYMKTHTCVHARVLRTKKAIVHYIPSGHEAAEALYNNNG